MKICQFYVLIAVILFVGCNSSKPSDNSPSGVLKQYVAASQKSDVAAMKNLLSKGSLELIEKAAKAQNSTTDELLRKESSVKIKNAIETRNEKIEGDAATVEIKNETNGEFDMKMPFVREGGAWKIARDKYIAEEMKKANEEINKKLANSRLSDSNSAPVSNANSSSK